MGSRTSWRRISDSWVVLAAITVVGAGGCSSADSAAAADSVAAARADSIESATAQQVVREEPPAGRYRAGEDPAFAEAMGWPVDGPAPLPGAILPEKRIIAYYGNPLSKRMGALGEFPKDEMLRRFEDQLEEWRLSVAGVELADGSGLSNENRDTGALRLALPAVLARGTDQIADERRRHRDAPGRARAPGLDDLVGGAG